MREIAVALALFVSWVGVEVAPAAAQLDRSTLLVEGPPLSLAAPDSPQAVDLNPAALPYLPGWSVAYVHADGLRSSGGETSGDALYAATPIVFGTAAGISIEHVRPDGGPDRGVASLALAFAPSAEWSGGLAVRWVGSSDLNVDGTSALDAAVSWRPAHWLATTLMGRELGVPLGFGGPDAHLSLALSIAVRPFATDALTLEAAAAIDDRLGDSPDPVVMRFAAAARIPWLGHLLAGFDTGAGDAGRLTLGLAVDWGSYGVGGGVGSGDGPFPSGGAGWYATARLEGVERDGLPMPRWVLDLEVRGGVGERRMITLVTQLDRALHDDRVRGVLLRLRDTGIGMAYAQELRWLIERLQHEGKPVVCQFDSASGSEWYACAGARATLLDPAGDVRLMGPATEVMHFGELLSDLGVRVEFVRIGEYKSYPEEFTNRTQSDPARRQRDDLLDDVFARLIADGADDMRVDRHRMRSLIDEGPYFGPEALDARIVDGYGDEWALDERLEELFDGSYSRVTEPPARAPQRWLGAPRLGMVVVDGSIVDGDNVDVPFVGIHMSGARTVVRAIDALAADPSVRAIVLRVDSGGGSALASDQIWRALMRARVRKPIVASLGAVAASGGYYVAAAGHEIWADPTTVTGSIGIFFGKADVVPLAERFGIHVEQMRRGRHAGAESIWRPFTAEERALLADKVRLGYRLFLRRVASARGMEMEAVDAVGRGRIWSGDAARRNGLVDRLGGLGAAMARARTLGNLPEDCEVVVVPRAPATLLDYVLGQGGSHIEIDAQLRDAIEVALTMQHVHDGAAMAMMPEIVSAP